MKAVFCYHVQLVKQKSSHLGADGYSLQGKRSTLGTRSWMDERKVRTMKFTKGII